MLLRFRKWIGCQLDLDGVDERNETILMIAIEKRGNECINILLDKESVLYIRVKNRPVSLLLYLCQKRRWEDALVLLKAVKFKVEHEKCKCLINFKETDQQGHNASYLIKHDKDQATTAIRKQLLGLVSALSPSWFG